MRTPCSPLKHLQHNIKSIVSMQVPLIAPEKNNLPPVHCQQEIETSISVSSEIIQG